MIRHADLCVITQVKCLICITECKLGTELQANVKHAIWRLTVLKIRLKTSMLGVTKSDQWNSAQKIYITRFCLQLFANKGGWHANKQQNYKSASLSVSPREPDIVSFQHIPSPLIHVFYIKHFWQRKGYGCTRICKGSLRIAVWLFFWKWKFSAVRGPQIIFSFACLQSGMTYSMWFDVS